ncbi:MAG TPA: nuclear transport factor 2 family protein [Pyrinomonadaceae bacterium]|nr:nuclear transport factor 2 family protein [Pyrinomonadaceae bacterium]
MIEHFSSGKEYDETETQNLKLIGVGFDNWKKGAGSPYSLLARDARWTIVGDSLASRTYNGRQDFIDNVITPFNKRMSKPLDPTIRRLYADGDTVIAFFDARGIATDGKPYTNTYAWFLRLRDGEIVEATAFFDSVRFNDLWTRVTPARQAAK